MPVLDNAYVDNAKKTKEIKRNVENTIVLEGSFLIGKVFLRKTGQVDVPATMVRVAPIPMKNMADPPMGNLSKVYATFDSPAIGFGWELVIKNSKGEAKSEKDFRFID